MTSSKDAKLIQYLNEAYGKEKELELALGAHIAMTSRPPYKKRLQQHLRETKGHARQLERRIKQLGGKAEAAPVPQGTPDVVGDAAARLTAATSKAVAAAKGPLHAIRGTGEAEKMLKNAKTEYFNEFEEIATYTSIEALADAVHDRETATLARGIRREEERMAKFLERQIPQLTKAVVRDEIPPAERRNGGRRPARRKTTAPAARGGSGSRARSSSARTARRSSARSSRGSSSRSARGGASRPRSRRSS